MDESQEEQHQAPPVYPVYQVGTDSMGQQVFYGVHMGAENQMYPTGEVYQNQQNFHQMPPQFFSPVQQGQDPAQFAQPQQFMGPVSPQQQQEQQQHYMYNMQNPQYGQQQLYPQQMQPQMNFPHAHQQVYGQMVDNNGQHGHEARAVSALFDNASENYTANWVSSTSSIPAEQKVLPEVSDEVEPADFGGTWPPTRNRNQNQRHYDVPDNMMAGTSANTVGGFMKSPPPRPMQKLEHQVAQLNMGEQQRQNAFAQHQQQQSYLQYHQNAYPALQHDQDQGNMAATSMVVAPQNAMPMNRPTYSDMVKRGAPPSQHIQVHINKREQEQQAKAQAQMQQEQRSKRRDQQQRRNDYQGQHNERYGGNHSRNQNPGPENDRRRPQHSNSQPQPQVHQQIRPLAAAQPQMRRNTPQPSQNYDANFNVSPVQKQNFDPRHNRNVQPNNHQQQQFNNWQRTASRSSNQPGGSRSMPVPPNETLHFDLTQNNCPQQQHSRSSGYNQQQPQLPFPQNYNVPPPNAAPPFVMNQGQGCAVAAGPPSSVRQVSLMAHQMGMFRPQYPLPYHLPSSNPFFMPSHRPLSPQKDVFRNTWLDAEHLPHDQLIAELTLMPAAQAHNNNILHNKGYKNPPNVHGHMNSLLATAMRLVNTTQPNGYSAQMVGAVPGAQQPYRGGPPRPRMGNNGNRFQDNRRSQPFRGNRTDQDRRSATSGHTSTEREQSTSQEPESKSTDRTTENNVDTVSNVESEPTSRKESAKSEESAENSKKSTESDGKTKEATDKATKEDGNAVNNGQASNKNDAAAKAAESKPVD
ncbi:unnamed protein product [Bursaphelenchus okinawaensis]|uniref:Uncharacterized protein n=1 Tax=Bursaphelenchus okinawaensis TaxID=465554 RepID=A0A811LIA7_9BILA|nr:unnamed protein product [Bursaphelenchus okinawaensis]CAG9123754.1 unnamed protein product [Bursaphelenchus okinawaensis]